MKELNDQEQQAVFGSGGSNGGHPPEKPTQIKDSELAIIAAGTGGGGGHGDGGNVRSLKNKPMQIKEVDLVKVSGGNGSDGGHPAQSHENEPVELRPQELRLVIGAGGGGGGHGNGGNEQVKVLSITAYEGENASSQGAVV